MPYFVVRYDYTDDTTERDRLRPGHREFLGRQQSLMASGPTDDGGAVLVFEALSSGHVEALLDDDPFAEGGVVARRTIARWDLVLGRWAEQP